ncbi:MAG: DMT family transporter [Pseudomonadota bacterium]
MTASPQARMSLPDTPAAGVALMTVSMLIAPGMDVLAKLLTETISPGQTAIGRFFATSILLAPLITLTGGWGRPTGLHALGGLLLGAALFCITAAVAVMPVANAIAIFFVEPLILTLLSAALLGERLGWRRLLAVAIGLFGAVVVLRPNVAEYGTSALLPLGAAVTFAGYLIVIRVMSQRGQRLALQFWSSVFAFVALVIAAAIAAPLAWAPMALGGVGLREMGLMLAMGLISCVTHQLLSHAFARAEAGALAPLQYLEIISAVALGWLVFGDFPDALTWTGTAIIIASGIYVFHRERQSGRGASSRKAG